MTILDQKFQVFHQLPSHEKTASFLHQEHLFDVICSQQFDRSFLDTIYHITNKLRKVSKSKQGHLFLQSLLPHKRAMIYFNQPSSRTFLSFENACHILGMKTSEIRDPQISSEVKGESFDDAIRTFSSYTDLIIMRTKEANLAERAAWLLNTYSNRPVPVINGGSGSDQHPTQAILDVYTLQRSFAERGGLDGKTILMCGDLKRGRTVRSLSYLMKNFAGVKIIFTAPSIFQMEEDILCYLKENKIPYEISTRSLRDHLGVADAIYMTRIQDEHDQNRGDSAKVDISAFKLKEEDMKLVKPHSAILHPFPRRDEIEVSIDVDSRAKYWRQERNGMWTRTALMAYIFHVHQDILDFPL